MDQRLEVIQKMRNQEATSHYQLNQALQGTPYHSYRQDRDILYHPHETNKRGYGYGEGIQQEESHKFFSFKIRLMLAILLGVFLFSIRTSDKAEVVTKVIQHIGENQTIEEVTDQAEEFLYQTKDKVSAYLSKQ